MKEDEKKMTLGKTIKIDVIDIIGCGIGLISSGLLVSTMYKIITQGYAHYIENNSYISISEFIIGIGGVSYFIYKLIELSLPKKKK